MKKEWADKWVEALRSGRYKQSMRELRNVRGYCCLGVLCEISGLGEWRENNVNNYLHAFDFLNATTILPEQVQELVEMKNPNGEIMDSANTNTRYDENVCLATMNDRGSSFEDIAKVIEERWAEL